MIFCLEKQIFLHRKIIFPKPFWLAFMLVLLTLIFSQISNGIRMKIHFVETLKVIKYFFPCYYYFIKYIVYIQRYLLHFYSNQYLLQIWKGIINCYVNLYDLVQPSYKCPFFKVKLDNNYSVWFLVKQHQDQ